MKSKLKLMIRLALCLLLLFVFAVPAFCEEPRLQIEQTRSHDEQAFQDELGHVARTAFERRNFKVSRIRAVNESYELSGRAIQILAEEGDVKAAIPLLREAVVKYDGNRLAYLLLGSALERQGMIHEAAEAYGDFYRFSLTLAPEENKLISPSNVRLFRAYVESRFEEWRRDLPKEKVPVGVNKLRAVVMIENSPAAQWINMILPMLVVGGLIFLMLGRLWDLDLPPALNYFLVSFFILLCAAYGFWAAHFFLGVPFWRSIQEEFTGIFSAGTVLIVFFFFLRRFLPFRGFEEKMEGTAKCPHCKGTVLKLEMVCRHCRKPV